LAGASLTTPENTARKSTRLFLAQTEAKSGSKRIPAEGENPSLHKDNIFSRREKISFSQSQNAKF
jgi:hypothetical protein